MKNKLLDIITDIKMWSIVLIVIIFRLIVFSDYSEYSIYFDTASYIEYDANILKGEVDAFRTPIFPYIIKLVSLFTDDLRLIYIGTTFVHEIISIISVIILYVTLDKMFKSQIAKYTGTLLYACFPAIFTYNKVILTESLSVSFYVIYFCLILQNIKETTTAKTIGIGVFTLFLILLRPSFLYLLVALGILYVLIFLIKKENRKQAIIGGISLLSVVIMLFVYCFLNKKQNDIFAISNVTQINQLDTIIQMGIYKTEDEKDKGIIEIIESNLDAGMTVWFRNTTNKIMSEYTPEEVDEYIGRCIKNNFSTYFNKTIQKVFNIASVDCDEIYLRKRTSNAIGSTISFGLIYLYAFLEAIYIVIKGIKIKKVPTEQFIMLILILGQLATIIIGAQAEYSRLFITSLPIVLISITWHIEEIINSREKIKDSLKKIKEKYNEIMADEVE